jgi:YidC/Oxa1 family membrane protein insertase
MNMINKVSIPRWRQLLPRTTGSGILTKQRPKIIEIPFSSTITSFQSDRNVQCNNDNTKPRHLDSLRQLSRNSIPLSLLLVQSYNTGIVSSTFPSPMNNHARRTFFTFGRKPENPQTTTSSETNSPGTTTEAVIVADVDDDDYDDFSDGHTTTVVDGGEDAVGASVDETLNKLFAEQSSLGTTTTESDAWYSTAENLSDATALWDPTWYNVADNAVIAINTVQQVTGLPYGFSIIVTTAILRIVLFPLMVHAQRAASRMTHVQPELQALKERYERISSPTRSDQMQFSTNMQALFTRYKVNPFQTIIAPVVQIPLFIGMFFGIKKVSTYFPDELKTGGMLWFVDLSVPDPMYILPLMSSATFLLLIELGKDQMLRAGGSSVAMLNVFRFMCVVSLPLVVNFEASMLVYWISNNLLTCCQTLALQTPTLRKQFGILEPPRPPPGSDPNKDSIVASVTDLVNRAQGKAITDAQKIQKHNQEVEAKKVSTRLTRAARERERRRMGITGTRNY